MKKYELNSNKLNERISDYFGYKYNYMENKENVISVLYQRIISKKISQDVIEGILSKKDFLDNLEMFMKNITKNDLKQMIEGGDSKDISLVVDSVGIPDFFVETLAKRFSKSLETFLKKLEESVQSKFVQSKITPILREIHPIVQKMEKYDVDEAFIFIEMLSKKEFSSDMNSNSWNMFFMIFLPRELRLVIQEFIIFNMIINDLENRKPYLNNDCQDIVFLLQEDLRYNILFNSHWARLIEDYGSSNEVKEKMKKYSQKSNLVLRSISEILREKNISIDFIETLRIDSYCHIRTSMELLVYAYDLSDYHIWSYTDVGHGFKDTSNLGMFIFDEKRIKKNSIKSEVKALILEDDSQQMEIYSNLIYECTKYNPTLLLDNPDDVAQYLDDKDVQYFLIDIENREDKTAGIRIAIMVLEYYIKKIASNDNVPEIHIKLWSSSQPALEQAWLDLNRSNIIKEVLVNESSVFKFGKRFLHLKGKIIFSLCSKNYDPTDFEWFSSYERAKEILA